VRADHGKRVRIECKATVLIGEGSRGGLTRGASQACDHDLGLKEKYRPGGIVDEESGQLHMTFGSSYKTSDFIVEALEAWWAAWAATAQVAMRRLQSKMDNGPESRGRRTQFWHRMVAFCDASGKPIQRLYYPPYHSKYNPLERCGGILELHWNGTKLVHVETMVEGAKSMTWKGIHPIVALSRKAYQKGVALSKRAMHAVESRLARHPELPQWDILIHPVSA
jgi:Rhodopirellula transposase DDE domain